MNLIVPEPLPSEILDRLKRAGLSDEAIAVGMAEFLNGVNPSAKSIKRWRTNRGAPTKAYAKALQALYHKLHKEEPS